MKQGDLIREAVREAREDEGLIVRPGPMLHSNSKGLIACDLTGAVMLSAGGYVWTSFSKGWLALVCKHLDVDTFWMYRFWMGADRDFQMQTWVQHSKESGEWVDDKISKWARGLARELYT